MVEVKGEMPKINLLHTQPLGTESNSFKKEKFKNKLRKDFYSKIKKLKKDYGCRFTIDIILSKLGYKPYIFNEVPNDNEYSYLIEHADDMIHNIYGPNDVFGINDAKKIPYCLDQDNYNEYNNNIVYHIGSKNSDIEENISALKNFILNVQKYQEEYHKDLDYGIIAREDSKALVIYLGINYNLYEYTFTMKKKENKNKFLDEIINFFRDKPLRLYH